VGPSIGINPRLKRPVGVIRDRLDPDEGGFAINWMHGLCNRFGIHGVPRDNDWRDTIIPFPYDRKRPIQVIIQFAAAVSTLGPRQRTPVSL
jgi:hypothetical protein